MQYLGVKGIIVINSLPLIDGEVSFVFFHHPSIRIVHLRQTTVSKSCLINGTFFTSTMVRQTLTWLTGT